MGVFQLALFLREREERQTDVFSDLPNKGKRERKTNTFDFTEKKSKREGKKTNRQPKHIKEREREREKESVFLKERETFFLLSLSPFSDFGGRSELKSRQTFFVSPRETDLII